MTLRSPSRGAYLNRLTIVVLLALAVYAMVAAESGGDAFRVWRPDRMRLALIALVVVGVAAYEFRPVEGLSKKEEQEDIPQVGSREAGVVSAVPEVPVAAEEMPRTGQTASVPEPKPVAKEPVKGSDETSSGEKAVSKAEEAWNRAREMRHGFVPDEIADIEYLKLVRESASLGHAPAMAKLGDYAFRRGWIVEAYYWTLLAQLHGASGLGVALAEIRKAWAKEGCPPEYENVRPDFSETQGMFARAVLRLKCGRDAALARRRLRELRDANCPEALLYLSKAQGLRV